MIHIPAGFEPAIDPQGDAIAELIVHQHLMHFRQAQFPGHPGMLNRAEGERPPGATVVTRNLDTFCIGLSHPGGDGTNPHLGHQLYGHPSLGIDLGAGQRSAEPGPQWNKCRGGAAAKSMALQGFERRSIAM